MELLAIIFSAAGALWLAVLLRHSVPRPEWVVPAGVVGLLVAECVFGAAFFKLETSPVPVTVDRILVGGLVGWTMLGWWHQLRRTGAGAGLSGLVFTRLDVAIVFWIVVLTTSTLMSDFGFRERLPLTRLLFFNIIPVAGFVVVRSVEWRDAGWSTVQWGLMGLALFLTLSGICEWRGWHELVVPRHTVDPTVTEFLGRARGPLQNPVINGMLINAGLAAAMLATGRVQRAWRVLPLLLVPLFLVGSYATLTRSVWVVSAVTFGFLVLAPLDWRGRAAVCAAGMVMLLGVAGLFGDQLNRFKRDRDVSASEMAQSVELRPLLATVAWEMFRHQPLGGVGFGQYAKHKLPYHYAGQYDAPLTMALPYMQHNVVLSYATETGLIGLGALLAIVAIGCWQAWRMCCLANGPWMLQHHGLFVLCLGVNYLVNGMFHDVSIIAMCHMLMLLFLGMTSSLAAQHLRGEVFSPPVRKSPERKMGNPVTPSPV